MSQQKGMKVVGARAPVVWLLIVVAVVVMAGLAVGGLVLLPRRQAEQHYQAGVAFQNVSDWAAAEGEYKQVISLDANYKDVQARLGEVKGRLTESSAAITAQALAFAQQTQVAAEAAATAQAQATAEAQANAAATAAAAPTATAEALEQRYKRALGLINLEQWVEAQAELRAVFDTDPNYKDVQAQLALVNMEVAKLTPTATPTPLTTPTPKVTSTPTATSLPSSLFFDDFDDGDAQGWTPIGSEAKVVDGKYVAIGNPTIVTLAGSETWRNYSVRTRAKVVSGAKDFGIVVRASEDCRLYLLQFWGDQLRIVRFDGGNCANASSYSHSVLSSTPYRVEEGVWYDIRIDVRGAVITAYVNEAQMVSAEDAFYSQGKIGLRAQDTQMFFDDVEVTPLANH